ncbi:MAG: hypothetical protein PHY56_01825, partial [Candidatus Omnitrophica bacterium]|nr:hypothetical protein [Candidatus Omnitrophota bacterium]
MIFRPQLKDLKVIGFFFGKIIMGLGFWFIVPMVTAVIFKEPDAFLDFSISFIFSLCLGLGLSLLCYVPKDDRNLDWVH